MRNLIILDANLLAIANTICVIGRCQYKSEVNGIIVGRLSITVKNRIRNQHSFFSSMVFVTL